MDRTGLLVNYKNCDHCGKCVEACRAGDPSGSGKPGLMLVPSIPETGPGNPEPYYLAVPTDYCRKCWKDHGKTAIPACASACPGHCLVFDNMETLGQQLTQKQQALFSLQI